MHGRIYVRRPSCLILSGSIPDRSFFGRALSERFFEILQFYAANYLLAHAARVASHAVIAQGIRTLVRRKMTNFQY